MSQCKARHRTTGVGCSRPGGHWSEHRNGDLVWDDIEAEEKSKREAREKEGAALLTLTAAALTGLLANPALVGSIADASRKAVEAGRATLEWMKKEGPK